MYLPTYAGRLPASSQTALCIRHCHCRIWTRILADRDWKRTGCSTPHRGARSAIWIKFSLNAAGTPVWYSTCFPHPCLPHAQTEIPYSAHAGHIPYISSPHPLSRPASRPLSAGHIWKEPSHSSLSGTDAHAVHCTHKDRNHRTARHPPSRRPADLLPWKSC